MSNRSRAFCQSADRHQGRENDHAGTLPEVARIDRVDVEGGHQHVEIEVGCPHAALNVRFERVAGKHAERRRDHGKYRYARQNHQRRAGKLQRDPAGERDRDREHHDRVDEGDGHPHPRLLPQDGFERVRHAVENPERLAFGVECLKRREHERVGCQHEGECSQVQRLSQDADRKARAEVEESLGADDQGGEQQGLHQIGAVARQQPQLATLNGRQSCGRNVPPLGPGDVRAARDGLARACSHHAIAQLPPGQ